MTTNFIESESFMYMNDTMYGTFEFFLSQALIYHVFRILQCCSEFEVPTPFSYVIKFDIWNV